MGEVATLASEIEQLATEIQANKKAQAVATTIRQKNNGEYMATTAEMKEVLAALEKAIQVLRDGTAFLQQDSVVKNAVQRVIEVLPSQAALKPRQQALLNQITGRGSDATGYAPQSWTVQGILTDMYTTFAADLETATHTEATQNRQYEELMNIKVEQLAGLEKDKADKEGKKASAEELLADRTQSYDDTTEQMKTDVAFFDETKDACKTKHQDWETRKSLRSEELSGIEKALEILTSDEARDLFASTIKPGKETHIDESKETGVNLLQLSATSPAENAYAALKTSASKAQSLRLAALASRISETKVGHFDAVLSAIDTMMKTLSDEGQADINKRDQCIEEYKNSDSEMANLTWLIRKNTAKIDKLERLIEKREAEKAQTVQDIADVQEQMRDMTAERKAENEKFLASKKSDQDAIKLLQQATTALSAYYGKNDISMGPIQGNVKGLELNQQGPDFDIAADQSPDATFSGKGSRKNESKGIVQLLTMITEDLEDEIRNAMTAEEKAQLAYEKQMAAAKASEADLIDKKINLESVIGKRTEEKDDEIILKGDNEKELDDEKKYRKRITPDCDWIMGAFDTRATKRAAEMDGLGQAKDYLAGQNTGAAALIDRGHGDLSNRKGLSSIRFLSLEP